MRHPGDCKEWDENQKKLDSVCLIAGLHGQPYSGKAFEFCPWCGVKLEFEEKD